MNALVTERGLTVPVISHDMRLIDGCCRDVVVLDRGRLLMRGTPGEVRADARVIEAYFGNDQPYLRDVIEASCAGWNARGGYHGRPVKLITENSGQDPTATAAAGQKIINSDHVLAMVGNAAVLDCSVNAQLIESSGTPVISNPNDHRRGRLACECPARQLTRRAFARCPCPVSRRGGRFWGGRVRRPCGPRR